MSHSPSFESQVEQAMAGTFGYVMTDLDRFLSPIAPEAFTDAHFDETLGMAVEEGFNANDLPLDFLLMPRF